MNGMIYEKLAKSRINEFFKRRRGFILEYVILVLVAFFYAGSLLDFDSTELQQTGEHNESSTRPLLAEIGLKRYREVPLWNHYMQTGFPAMGDLMGHFWSPVSLIPIWVWGGINGMKVSIFITFLLAGFGQWYLSYVAGLKGVFRLWSSLIFMVSGGLTLLWRVGWYGLLLGIAWFPWSFASFWQALSKRDGTSVVWAAFCISMTLLPGTGYYPFYLGGSLGLILLVKCFLSKTDWHKMLTRSALTAFVTFEFTAVMALPLMEGYRRIIRDVPDSPSQPGSQPISYALINYIIADPDWLDDSRVLGADGGWTWFYMGSLSLAGLIGLPLAFRKNKSRPFLIGMMALAVFLLFWHANRYTPMRYVYDWFPILSQLRFPGRLLYVASIPILIVSAACMQRLFMVVRNYFGQYNIAALSQGSAPQLIYNLRFLAGPLATVILLVNFYGVYKTNKEMAFAPESLNETAFSTLNWLKDYDPSLYYVNIGGGVIWWDWTPAAYDLEIPFINYNHNQLLKSKHKQLKPGAPFYATAKYQISPVDDQPPGAVTVIKEFDDFVIFENYDALPFAFSAPPEYMSAGAEFDSAQVAAIADVHYDGPNGIKATGKPGKPGDLLIVLVSDYPGWMVFVDGKLGSLKPVNGYLGTEMLPGNHTYEFVFDPPLYHIGLAITRFTIYVALIVVFFENFTIKRMIALKLKKRMGGSQFASDDCQSVKQETWKGDKIPVWQNIKGIISQRKETKFS